jgi:ABC-type molybdate transport system substrate-binding protein
MQQSAVVQKTVRILAAVILVAMVVYTGGEAEARQKVVIFHAGSLKVPFAEIEKRFEKKYPAIDVVREFGGSTKMARMITEKNKAADIMASADFDNFYHQAAVKVTGPKSGTWITRTGKSVTYSVTMIKDSANPDGALLFLQYMLTPDEGLAILKSLGQPPFVPCRVPNPADYQLLPAKLKTLVEVRP